jgi:hypothetical protein
MQALGLTVPASPSTGYGAPPTSAQPQMAIAPPQTVSVGGIMSASNLTAVLNEEKRAAAERASMANNQPVIQSLASQIRRHWDAAKQAKLEPEREMLRALRAKRGQYDPEKLAEIKQQGGSEIYMMLFATKARQFKSLVGDIILGAKDDKPWTISPTPSPEIPQDVTQAILQAAMQVVMQAEMAGIPMSQEEVRQGLSDVKDQVTAKILEEANTRCDRASVKLEDLLTEGGFGLALDQFLDDLTTSKTAFLKGPVIRKHGQLTWVQQPDGTSVPEATVVNKPFWERVDPLNMYPAPWARDTNDAYLLERHKLTPTSLSDLIGVDGYSEDAIRQVLDAYGRGGLHEWLQVDSERAVIEQRNQTMSTMTSDTIEALQYWGSVTGKMLREWGLGADEVPDEAKSYEIEAWLIGQWVIKASINSDPLARRPYYSDGFDRVPGSFWHNSLFDVMCDCQDMCNAAARALANNMGISSGPQVWVSTDRLPPGENITSLYPWKIWQVTSDQMGSTAAPMGFFQPDSNAAPLMGVFDKFSILADEYTGIPRYMTGGPGGAGEAGRTASGMSMMIGNASKTIKKQVQSLDTYVIGPCVGSGYEFLMRYSGDPDIKGDLTVKARGALSLTVKEAAQVRRAEFLAATANPIDMSIIGVEGRAAVLRETAGSLDMNTDDVVPPLSVIKAKKRAEQMAMLEMQQAQQAARVQDEAAKLKGQVPGGNGQLPTAARELMNGAPVTEQFQNTPA